ncbi:hypothetical protein [Pyrobaculum ferrireducens]|nr:hypothetical protein [Pyrobaculum ferrireducens]
MPTKLKGMTSLEIAIIVAIVLVIAIAVGWYLYTTFAAAGQQASLTVVSAKITTTEDGATLTLEVVPQGGASVQIKAVEIAGTQVDTSKITPTLISGPTTVIVTLDDINVAVGQVLTGRVVLSNGAVAPFSASVVAGGGEGAP